jgi:hypothetical protein
MESPGKTENSSGRGDFKTREFLPSRDWQVLRALPYSLTHMPLKKKSNNRKKKNQAARKQSRDARSRAVNRARFTPPRPSIGPATLMFARSVQDPWKYSACVPDGANGLSCFTVRQVVDLSTGIGGGAGAVAIQLDPANATGIDNGSTQNTFNFLPAGAWSAVTNITAIKALYARWRPVSCGIRATYVGSTMNDQGLLVVAQFPGTSLPNNLNLQTTALAYAAATYAEVYPLKNGGQITWRSEDSEDFQMNAFSGTGTQTFTSQNLTQLPWLFVGFTGAQSTTATQALRVEVVWNFQGLLATQTFLPGSNGLAMTETPAEVGWYEKASNLYKKVLPYMPGTAAVIQGLGAASGTAAFAAKAIAFGTAGIPNYLRGPQRLTLEGTSRNGLYDLD